MRNPLPYTSPRYTIVWSPQCFWRRDYCFALAYHLNAESGTLHATEQHPRIAHGSTQYIAQLIHSENINKIFIYDYNV